MSKVVRLKVPPFEPTSPTSLEALRRPLVKPETTRCDAHCKPCQTCDAAQKKAIKAAQKTASDLGLRLSQLVEEALATQLKRIEAQQAALITTVLEGVLPHLADLSLRRALMDELANAAEPLKSVSLRLRKHPSLDLGEFPDTSSLIFEDDPSMPVNKLELCDGDARTILDAQSLIHACLVRLGKAAPDAIQTETLS